MTQNPKITETRQQSKGNILLGICGGIAAYKIPGLVSLLSQQGYRVRVVLSEAASRFVSSEVLEIMSGQTVYHSLWQNYEAPPNGQTSPVLHIALVEEANIFLVAPASYNWIGKAALGIADNLLSTLFAAWPLPSHNQGDAGKPLLFAPTMNPEMWNKSILKNNIKKLQDWGCELVAPNSGFLACRSQGQGRMAEVEELYFRLESRLRFSKHKAPLQSKRLLISAGPTREAIDPVRYLSNRSSGRLGIAIACAARDMGAEVTLLSGLPEQSSISSLPRQQNFLSQQLFGIHVLHCDSAKDMALHAAEQFPNCDWALAVAAVCDFCAAQPQQQKIKKSDSEKSFSLQFQLTPDILAYWGQHKKPGQKVLGFALEHTTGPNAQDAETGFALAKLHSKNADAIVLNRADNLESEWAQGQLFFDKEPYTIKRQSKRDFAAELLLRLCQQWM